MAVILNVYALTHYSFTLFTYSHLFFSIPLVFGIRYIILREPGRIRKITDSHLNGKT